ncbi:hypothetical protein [Bosea vaviloviae]|uniref:AB hydrolase-1 domain-containing protein n=1 Tax=Bosea vaviloviae TaxID=1526658 RepID=A0A1D7U6L8_9HYPH|nr:hypothetical protein [Bosea vaviloviae]AOO82982.1 hypothetical protein BHK69_23315 [Bosea vaviloviae]
MMKLGRFKRRAMMIVAGCALVGGLAMASCSGPDQLYHRVCADGPSGGDCIKREHFVQTRGDDCAGAGRAMCFGTGNDGWDTGLLGTHPGMTPSPFEYAALEYRSDVDATAQRWQPQQMEAIVDRIAAIRRGGQQVYLVTFVHGWHHNAQETRGREDAAPQNRNLRYFKHILAKSVAELAARGSRNHRVVGVYVGWNGGDATSMLTIGDRARAADRIGTSNDFATDLSRLADAAGSSAAEAGAEGRMLVIGHSFGGRIVSRFMLRQVAEGRGWAPLGPRTLVSTINPAIGADAFDALMALPPADTSLPPSWVNFTSTDDYATGIVFSTAATIGRVAIFGYGVTDRVLSASGYQAIGHYRPYVTHRLAIDHFKAQEKPGLGLVAVTQRGWPGPCHVALGEETYPPVLDGRRTDWFRIPTGVKTARKAVWFGGRETECVSRHYVSTLSTGGDEGRDLHSVPGRMWNVTGDRNLVDAEGLNDTSTPLHNAFVQTLLTRMLLELTFAQAVP